MSVALPEQQFSNVVRWVKRCDLETVNQLSVGVKRAMARLGLRTRMGQAIASTPPGSDQADVGSVNSWLDKVLNGDGPATNQVVALDATIRVRLN